MSRLAAAPGEIPGPPDQTAPIPPPPQSEDVRLSVIIACYNDGRYLLEALQSVASCGDQHFETLIADDGSDEATTLEVLAAAERQGWQVLRLPHQGLAATRNAAIQQSQGEFILPLDADNRL